VSCRELPFEEVPNRVLASPSPVSRSVLQRVAACYSANTINDASSYICVWCIFIVRMFVVF